MGWDYDRYIRSKAWAQFRQQYYAGNRKRYGRFTCEECGLTDFTSAPELHHLSYDHFGNESLVSGQDVVLLCLQCHDLKHLGHPDRPTTFQSLAAAIAAM